MISLPIDSLLPQIVDAIAKSDRVILTATPGAGKTTRLPPELLKSVSGKIAVLEPRRLATIGAAQRIADERQWQLGKEVGYQVRLESKLSASTRLIFMTDAILLRHLTDDPELTEFDFVVIDEFHERNLNQDLVLGTIKELQELGRKIKLLIMSATLDVNHLKDFLPDSAHIDVPGLVFPLEIRHANKPSKPSTDYEFIERVSNLVRLTTNETRGDILVFLPGVSEISRVEEKLRDARLERDILPLHGSLPLAEQRVVLSSGQRPRIILTTNIAEASVTVPGTDTVIDTGLARVMTVNLKSGFEKLDLVRIAKFNAKQRAGRAARQKAGLCIRLWTTFEDSSLDEQMAPECQRVDLSSAILLLSHIGVHDFRSFSWLDRPPEPLFKFSLELLRSVQALDENDRITSTGRQLMQFPLSPRWGAVVIQGLKNGQAFLGARMAALLNDRDFLQRKYEGAAHTECDVTFRMQLLEEVEKRGRPSGVNLRQAETVLAASEQIEKQLPKDNTDTINTNQIKRILLLSQLDRLCRRRKGTDRALMVGGRGVRLAPESQVKESEFFLSLQAVELSGQADTLVSLACGFEKSFVLENLKDQITTIEDIYFDEVKGQFYGRRIRRFRDLDIDDPTLTPLQQKDIGDRLAQALEEKWLWLTEKNPSLKSWMARWNFLCRLDSQFEANLSKEQIGESIRLASFGKTNVSEILDQDFSHWIESTMDRAVVQDLNKHAPAYFVAATGNRYPIHYSENESPYVEVRLQEMFGVNLNPRLGFGQVPLTFKLLTPNYRPTQVTSDIASFWQSMYFEVRKELRTRYPKHSWPEDPLTAPPVAKGPKRRT